MTQESKSTRGGKRPGAGRRAGIPNRATAARAAEVAASGLTPLDYLLKVMRDEQTADDVRRDAAKAAAPYIHPKLSSVEANITGKITIGSALDQLDD